MFSFNQARARRVEELGLTASQCAHAGGAWHRDIVVNPSMVTRRCSRDGKTILTTVLAKGLTGSGPIPDGAAHAFARTGAPCDASLSQTRIAAE